MSSDHPSETAQSTGADSTTLTARRAVAHAVRHVRRWDEAGILAAFDAAAKHGHDFAAIAAALFDIAADPGAKTPGVLMARLANGWRREIQPPTPLPHLTQCADCHLRHAPDTPCGGHGSEPPPEYLEAKEALLQGGDA